ncbi:hypothetical protein B5K06_09425 [Rhizobium grahamii]|uniref:Uncharacterized protein n=1 Tax=Rhizobium grahamii TaxID=1120045 RepID=A0A370KS29_9HYPH|nr:hypothetical protein B5K06_09425 [Rhizobium grahamii]
MLVKVRNLGDFHRFSAKNFSESIRQTQFLAIFSEHSPALMVRTNARQLYIFCAFDYFMSLPTINQPVVI